MSLELLILDGPQAGRRLPVGPLPVIVGRSSAADISFPLDNFVSGRHVSFQADERGVLLNDLRSTNGTFLNGERITQALARLGDTIKIGSMTLQVVESQAATQGFPPPPPPAWDGVSAYQPLEFPQTEPFPAAASAASAPMPSPYTAAPAFSLPPMAIPAPPVVPAAFSPDDFTTAISRAAEPRPVRPTIVPQSLPPSYAPPSYAPVPADSAPRDPSPLNPPSAASMASASTTVISALNVNPVPPAPSQKVLAEARQKTEALLGTLREVPGPLFCLLNAGAEEAIPAMLALADVNLSEHCLLESEATTAPPRWAPYLLALKPEAPLLRLLVEKGWGKGWVSFFISFAPFEELRGHFRKFLMVQVANGGEPYFRFYEPAVLREFLVAGNPTELAMFFGPIDEWFLEAESKTALLKARNSAEGLMTTLLPLTESAMQPETARAL